MEPEIKYFTFDSYNYAYRTSSGSTRDIILLHGSAETSYFFWRNFFTEFGDKYRVVAIDLRGHGNSASPPNGYSAASQANLVMGLINILRLKKPVVIGHSLGGIIAAKYAIIFPSSLSSLVLYDCPISGNFIHDLKFIFDIPLSVSFPLGLVSIPTLGKYFFKFRTSKTTQKLLKDLKVFCDPDEYLTDEMIIEAMKVTYPGLAKSIRCAILGGNLMNELNKIQAPTLVIRGEHDILAPKEWMRQVTDSIPNAILAEIPGAAHLPLIEKPQEFNSVVENFISQY